MGTYFGNALLQAGQPPVGYAPTMGQQFQGLQADQRKTIQPVNPAMYGEGLPQGYVQWAMQNHPHLFGGVGQQAMAAQSNPPLQTPPHSTGYTDRSNFLGRFPQGYRPA